MAKSVISDTAFGQQCDTISVEDIMEKERKNSDARMRANAKYDAKWKRSYLLKLNRKSAPDVIKKLDSVPNKLDYITELIRADIARTLPSVQQTIDDIQKYKGYLPLQIYPTTDLSVIYRDLESDGYSDEEAADLLASDVWVKICSDGVIILADSRDAEFEWNGKKYTVKADRWTVE